MKGKIVIDYGSLLTSLARCGQVGIGLTADLLHGSAKGFKKAADKFSEYSEESTENLTKEVKDKIKSEVHKVQEKGQSAMDELEEFFNDLDDEEKGSFQKYDMLEDEWVDLDEVNFERGEDLYVPVIDFNDLVTMSDNELDEYLNTISVDFKDSENEIVGTSCYVYDYVYALGYNEDAIEYIQEEVDKRIDKDEINEIGDLTYGEVNQYLKEFDETLHRKFDEHQEQLEQEIEDKELNVENKFDVVDPPADEVD